MELPYSGSESGVGSISALPFWNPKSDEMVYNTACMHAESCHLQCKPLFMNLRNVWGNEMNYKGPETPTRLSVRLARKGSRTDLVMADVQSAEKNTCLEKITEGFDDSTH